MHFRVIWHLKKSIRKIKNACPDILAYCEETGQELEAQEGRLPSKILWGLSKPRFL